MGGTASWLPVRKRGDPSPPRSPSSSSGSPSPEKKPSPSRGPLEKVGIYKQIDDEEKRRKEAGEPPLDGLERDRMMRNFFLIQRGLAPLGANEGPGSGGGKDGNKNHGCGYKGGIGKDKGGGKGGKDGGKGMKPGDWTCPSCNASVFASKNECFKCGTAKPGAAGGGGGKGGGGKDGGGKPSDNWGGEGGGGGKGGKGW